MHYDDDVLLRFAEGNSATPMEIESHVTDCELCSARVSGHRDLVETLRAAETWETETPAPRQLVLDVVAFASRAKEEEQRARELCDEVLTGPASWWPQRLRKAEGGRTAGMVKELLERMRTLLERSPANALQVTALAVELANAIDVAEYPCDYVVKLRAQACRDHAYVLSYMGRYLEALEYADRSNTLFQQVPLPQYDLARLALVRASILRCIDRVPEAIECARTAAETFHRYGDAARCVGAKIWEANCVFGAGSYGEALERYKALENDPAVDPVSAVRLVHNIGLCHIQLGQVDLAATYLSRAADEFAMLGLDTERTRCRSSLGETLVAAGRAAAAIPVLQQARREFESLDMVADSGLAALLLAEAMLVTGDVSEVAAICRSLIARFTAAGMTSRAITALSFLREAIAIGQATPSLVRHVYDFLRELPAERPRLFASPPAGVPAD